MDFRHIVILSFSMGNKNYSINHFSESSCNAVLSSPFSTVPILGIPLSSVAFVSYSAIALLAAWPFLQSNRDKVTALTFLSCLYNLQTHPAIF